MQKVVIHKAGGYDRLQLETHPDPAPRAGEVLVRTEAVGVNYADCVVRMGLYESAKKYVGWPITPGFEFAGGGKFGITRFGGYATHVVVPGYQVWPIPNGWSAVQAASFPAVFMTAYYALFELAHPRRGHTVLVHSAAGGVGGALCQLLRIAGCRTVGVVGGAHKIEVARAAGADVVIDKSREDLWDAARRAAPDGYDLILDANGVSTLGASYRQLRSPGKLVVYGFASMLPKKGGRPDWFKLARDFVRTPRFSPLALTGANKSVLAFNLSYLFDEHDILAEGMGRLLGWVAEGKLTPPPHETMPLDRVADAHAALESGRTVGKLVLLTG
jgi:NADPH:quinone reductase-like Zn-dependent oxidoreductase